MGGRKSTPTIRPISLSDSRLAELGFALPLILLGILGVLMLVRRVAVRRGQGGDRRRAPTLAAIYAVMYVALGGPSLLLGLLLVVLASLGLWEWFRARPKGLLAVTGGIVILIGFLALFSLRLGPHGAGAALFLFFLVNASDSAAMVGGAVAGRRRLAPKISPGKTVEGSLIGVLVTVLLAPLFAWALGLPWDTVFLLLSGFLISVAGQLGDLVASVGKRRTGIKDFGTLLPGHGGILDRFDSTIIAAPIFLIWKVWWMTG